MTQHDPECTGCEHNCPWKGNPLGAPFCDVCDDHMEAHGAGFGNYKCECGAIYIAPQEIVRCRSNH